MGKLFWSSSTSPPPSPLETTRTSELELEDSVEYLPSLPYSPLPPNFQPRPPLYRSRSSKYDPSLLSFYGPAQRIRFAFAEASYLVERSRLRKHLELAQAVVGEVTDIGIAFDPPGTTTTGWLVRVQVFARKLPGDLACEGDGGQWSSMQVDGMWRFHSENNLPDLAVMFVQC